MMTVEVLKYKVFDDGDECYFDENGYWHRPNNKPAYISSSGYTEYWVHGKLHRTDGPAFIYPDGREYFFLDHIRYTKEDYWKEIERRNSPITEMTMEEVCAALGRTIKIVK